MSFQYYDTANEFISTLNQGKMPGVIYDTAVIGGLKDNTGISRFPNQVKTVLEHQFQNGSWGADYFNPFDRLLTTVSTLNMILKLDLQKDHSINLQFEAGVNWLEGYYDPNLNYNVPMPVGFEFLFHHFSTEIMSKTNHLNINLSEIEKDKERKLEKIGDIIYDIPTPLLFSIEGVVKNKSQAKKIAKFQSQNGSIGTSPAATSIIVEYGIDKYLPNAMRFLQKSIMSNGLLSHFHDYQYMNIAFSLYPLMKADFQFGVQGLHLIKRLNEGWSDNGVAFGKSFLTPDADDTSMVLVDLDFLGDPSVKDRMDILLQYEQEDHFQTYFGEVNPALMTNIHVFEAFLNIEHERGDEIVNKLTNFVLKNKDDLLNISKYNSSILIQQSSLVLSLFPKLPSIAIPILHKLEELIVETLSNTISTEEISHSLLALLYAKHCGQKVDETIVHKLYNLLTDNRRSEFLNGSPNETYTWSAKVQYSPTQISQAHVIGSLMLYDKLYR